jgi:hypothetical protein
VCQGKAARGACTAEKARSAYMQCLLFRTRSNLLLIVRNFWFQSAVGSSLRLDIAIYVVSMWKLERSILELNLCFRYLKMLLENDFSSAEGRVVSKQAKQAAASELACLLSSAIVN